MKRLSWCLYNGFLQQQTEKNILAYKYKFGDRSEISFSILS